jgi:hypothetical protein
MMAASLAALLFCSGLLLYSHSTSRKTTREFASNIVICDVSMTQCSLALIVIVRCIEVAKDTVA